MKCGERFGPPHELPNTLFQWRNMMTFPQGSQPLVRYYRLVVARGHLGRGKTEYATVYVRTVLGPSDLMFNRGKPIAGIKRVVELAPLLADDFAAAIARGEDCFAAVANRDR